jgi:hypothetical protein
MDPDPGQEVLDSYSAKRLAYAPLELGFLRRFVVGGGSARAGMHVVGG